MSPPLRAAFAFTITVMILSPIATAIDIPGFPGLGGLIPGLGGLIPGLGRLIPGLGGGGSSGLGGLIPGLGGQPGSGQVSDCITPITSIAGCAEGALKSIMSRQVGSISPECCSALLKLESSCWPKIFPLFPFPSAIKSLCPAAAAAGGGPATPNPPPPRK